MPKPRMQKTNYNLLVQPTGLLQQNVNISGSKTLQVKQKRKTSLPSFYGLKVLFESACNRPVHANRNAKQLVTKFHFKNAPNLLACAQLQI
jgi:hypothetical protein